MYFTHNVKEVIIVKVFCVRTMTIKKYMEQNNISKECHHPWCRFLKWIPWRVFCAFKWMHNVQNKKLFIYHHENSAFTIFVRQLAVLFECLWRLYRIKCSFANNNQKIYEPLIFHLLFLNSQKYFFNPSKGLCQNNIYNRFLDKNI